MLQSSEPEVPGPCYSRTMRMSILALTLPVLAIAQEWNSLYEFKRLQPKFNESPVSVYASKFLKSVARGSGPQCDGVAEKPPVKDTITGLEITSALCRVFTPNVPTPEQFHLKILRDPRTGKVLARDLRSYALIEYGEIYPQQLPEWVPEFGDLVSNVQFVESRRIPLMKTLGDGRPEGLNAVVFFSTTGEPTLVAEKFARRIKGYAWPELEIDTTKTRMVAQTSRKRPSGFKQLVSLSWSKGAESEAWNYRLAIVGAWEQAIATPPAKKP